nr:ribonuclease H-like domain-containing protein [Tanacetum cinerariifolium]
MAFMSTTISSTNRVVNTAQAVNTTNGVSTVSTQVNAINNLSDDVICAFLASQPNSPRLTHEDLEQIHPDDIEEMDLRWKIAMVNTVKGNNVNTARPKAVVNAVKGNLVNAFKASACWVWKPKTKVIEDVSKHNSASITLKKFDYIDAQGISKSVMAWTIKKLIKDMLLLEKTPKEEKSQEKVPLKLADEGFFVGYSLSSKAFRVFNSRTMIVEENLHIRFSENMPNVVGSRPDWLFDIDALTRIMNDEPIVAGTQSNDYAGTKACDNAENECNDQEKEDNVNNTNNVNTVNIVVTNKDNKLPFDPNMPALEDVGTFDLLNEDEDDNIVANMNNMDTTI